MQSCWHRDIVDQSDFLRTHAELDNRDVDLFEVPGVEIPLRAKILPAVVSNVDRHRRADRRWCIYRHEFVLAQ